MNTPWLPGIERPTEKEIARYIRTHVAEMLVGFATRQKLRAESRKQKRKLKGQSPSTIQEALFPMKSPVIFRAEFQQPKNSTMRLPCAVGVEIYHAKIGPPEWKARRPGTRIEFREIAGQSDPATLRRQIELLHFEKRLTEWQAFDASQNPARPLAGSEWKADKDGKVFLTEEYLNSRTQKPAVPCAQKDL